MRETKFRVKTLDGIWFYWKINDPIDMESMLGAIDWQTLGQYTGLLDKNSKEIYEGDILEALDGRKSKVVFDGGSFCVQHLDTENDMDFIAVTNYFEVIGNIYENSELLK